MPAKSKKRRREISGPGGKKHNDLWKATLPVRPCGLMLQKEKQKRREVKVLFSAKVGKVEPGKHVVNAAAGEWSSLSEAGEPKKALRVAMLKKCFADTIFKATHREHLDHSVQSDCLSLQQERERLQQEQREDSYCAFSYLNALHRMPSLKHYSKLLKKPSSGSSSII